jgi:hypothetical protein
VEIAFGLIGILLTFIGIFFSRTDRLLKEIRDLLVQIRDRLP